MNSQTKFIITLNVIGVTGIALSGQLIYDTLLLHGLDDPLHLVIGGFVSACIAFLVIIHSISTISILIKLRSDQLTGLDSRSQFVQRLEKTIKHAKPLSDTFHVILLDLNKFKQVNDTLSHAHGDELLKIIANRVRDIAQKCRSVARVGGDEFALLVHDTTEDRCIYKQIISSLIAAINEPIKLEDKIIYVGVSAGISTYPDSGRTVSELMRCAEIAMYSAKRAQKDYKTYNREDDNFRITDLTLSGEIKDALDHDDFEVWLQPIKDLKTSQIVAAESLLRWNHPIRGILTPDSFIPTAESTGLVKQLTHYLVKTATANYKTIKNRGHELNISINVSPNDITDSAMMTSILKSLVKADMSPSNLKLEVTETAIMHDRESSLRVLVALESLGIKLSIDDFGTGHSSFVYLKDFPIAEIKLDRSFITDISKSKESFSIVKSTIDLAHQLNALTVAEGVESDDVEQVLTELNCDRLQGYYLARPMPLDKFLDWLDMYDQERDSANAI